MTTPPNEPKGCAFHPEPDCVFCMLNHLIREKAELLDIIRQKDEALKLCLLPLVNSGVFTHDSLLIKNVKAALALTPSTPQTQAGGKGRDCD